MLVAVADGNQQSIAMLQGALAAERKSMGRLVAQITQLQQQLEQTRRELRCERQRRFTKDPPAVVEQAVSVPTQKRRKRRGAPVGHPGWYRP
jgi:predicted RNA-binding protein with PIN domain